MKRKIVYLANAQSIHTKRWAKHFADSFDIHILTFEPDFIQNVEVVALRSSFSGLWRYVLSSGMVRKQIQKIRPDILHAHYAGGYGLLGALTGFHPYVVSLWGSDVYVAPTKSFLRKGLLTYILGKSDYVCSTSNDMAKKARKYITKDIVLTPFGVDCDLYRPTDKQISDTSVVIGTVKKLDPLYGVDRLLKAFALLRHRMPDQKLKLLIVGDGSARRELEALSTALGIQDVTTFAGAAKQEDVPRLLNMLSIYVALSRSESYGVAVIEASACGVPVVVSDAGGLPEVVRDGATGFIIPSGNIKNAAGKIELLIRQESLRKKMGGTGRAFVSQHFRWEVTAKTMEGLYSRILQGTGA